MPSVLIIEDDRFNRRLYKDLLQAEGLEVRLACDAGEGVEMARMEPPDLIVMDIELPGMDGLEATQALKNDPRTAGVPVLAISAHAMGEHESKARGVGCESFLPKPLDLATFQAEVRRLVGV